MLVRSGEAMLKRSKKQAVLIFHATHWSAQVGATPSSIYNISTPICSLMVFLLLLWFTNNSF